MPEMCLLAVHAHPDDESSKTAGTVARYHAHGVHTVLVTCTGGEQGDILNPAMDRPGVLDRMAEIRRGELDEAARIIGYDEVDLLGYRDSGMPGAPANNDPRSFAQAPLGEAVERLVRVIRRTQPQVLLTYPENQKGYPHPDHLRVHEISVAAFDAAGDGDLYPGSGDPWQPLKLYYTVWSTRRMRLLHDKFTEMGLPSPYKDERLARAIAAEDEALRAGGGRTTLIDIEFFAGVSRRALLAHATQVDPTSPHWFGLPEDVADSVYPFEEYLLARNLTDSKPPEDDLFAGIRDPVRP